MYKYSRFRISSEFARNVNSQHSPLSTRAKKDSEDRRIIMDCSWLIGVSLNDGISKDIYLGELCNLKYPTLDTVTRRIFTLRQASDQPIFLWKEDLDRAFRQLYGCPSSVPLLGYRWRGLYYFDLVMVMGCRIAPYVCQRTTNTLAYIHRQMEYFIVNYVDDSLGVEYLARAKESHRAFVNLLDNLCVQRSQKKSVAPTEIVEFLGNLINTVDMTIGVTPQRKIQVLKELEQWHHRKVCTRRQLESLIGKLQFMSNCIWPGRLFISRLLMEMKQMKRDKFYPMSAEVRKDIKWWYLFLPGFKGTLILWLLDVEQIDQEFATDACMVAAGGVSGDTYFRCKFQNLFLQRIQR